MVIFVWVVLFTHLNWTVLQLNCVLLALAVNFQRVFNKNCALSTTLTLQLVRLHANHVLLASNAKQRV
jgi:hypothetical protein